MKISIIICTYNRDRYILKALESCEKQNFPKDQFEIILINNNSTDNTDNICGDFKRNYPKINFNYFIEKKQGLSFARNRGILEACGNVLVFIDDDAEADLNYLTNLNSHFENFGYIAGGGKILPKWEIKKPDWISKYLISLVSALDMGEETKEFIGRKFPIGANMFLKKSLIPKVGLFNTELGRIGKNMLGGEEKDFFYRIKNLGIPLYYLPDVKVWHNIPKERTTKEFVKKQGLGVGLSEQIRCLSISKREYLIRLLLELYKWAGSIVLCLIYFLKIQPAKGNMIIYFRYWVTLGLLKK